MVQPVGLEIGFDLGGQCLGNSIVDEEAFDHTKTLLIIDLLSLRLEDELNHLLEKIGEQHNPKRHRKDDVNTLNWISGDNVAKRNS